MKKFDAWWFPDHEEHLTAHMLQVNKRVRGRLTYQFHKFDAAFKTCRSFHTVVDVGAHVGLFSFWAASIFRHVHAFEPAPLHRECFTKNVEAPNVTLHPYALGAAPGHVVLEYTFGSTGDTKIDPTFDEARAAGSGLAVEMHRLDSFNLQNIDLMKIDCEGYEENVLVGALETIQRWKPVILVEQKRTMSERFGLQPRGAVRWLEHLGYKTALELGGDYIMVAQ